MEKEQRVAAAERQWQGLAQGRLNSKAYVLNQSGYGAALQTELNP